MQRGFRILKCLQGGEERIGRVVDLPGHDLFGRGSALPTLAFVEKGAPLALTAVRLKVSFGRLLDVVDQVFPQGREVDGSLDQDQVGEYLLVAPDVFVDVIGDDPGRGVAVVILVAAVVRRQAQGLRRVGELRPEVLGE